MAGVKGSHPFFVIPAQAGIKRGLIPAFAGMTVKFRLLHHAAPRLPAGRLAITFFLPPASGFLIPNIKRAHPSYSAGRLYADIFKLPLSYFFNHQSKSCLASCDRSRFTSKSELGGAGVAGSSYQSSPPYRSNTRGRHTRRNTGRSVVGD